MYPTLIKVEPIGKLKLELLFSNGEVKELDVSKYCKSNYFKELEDWDYFKKVRIKGKVPVWPNNQDLAPETIYYDSLPKITESKLR